MNYRVLKQFVTDAGATHQVGSIIEIKDKVEADRYIRMMQCIAPVESAASNPSGESAAISDNTVGTSDEKPARKK